MVSDFLAGEFEVDGQGADVVWLGEWFLGREKLLVTLLERPFQLLGLLVKARADDQLELFVSHLINVEIAVEMGAVALCLGCWTLSLHLVTLVDGVNHFDVIWNWN